MIALLILIAAVAYAGSIVAFGRGPLVMNSNIFSVIVNAGSVVIPLIVYALFQQQRHAPAGSSKAGWLWAVFGALCIGVFVAAFAFIFSKGQNVSYVTPLVYGGAVLLASVIGIVLYKENVSALQLVGLLLVVSGIVTIAVSSAKTGGAV